MYILGKTINRRSKKLFIPNEMGCDVLGCRTVYFGYSVPLEKVINLTDFFTQKSDTSGKRKCSYNDEYGLTYEQRSEIEKAMKKELKKYAKKNEALFEGFSFTANNLGFHVFYEGFSASYEPIPEQGPKVVLGYRIWENKIL